MAGGFFSGGSDSSVNASVALAERAAREAEEARDEINDKFVEFIGQTDEGSYTVPNADDALTTKFLNQLGDWEIPAGSNGASTLDDLTDVTITNVATNQFLQYNGTQWVNIAVDPADPLTAGTGLDITNNVVSVEDGGIGTNQLAANAITSAKIVDGGVMKADIADNAIDDGKLDATNTGAAGQILSAVGTGNFTWIDADGNTAYTASEGLVLVSDDFQIASDGVTTVKIIDDAITSAKILDDNITADELNVTGDGTAGQILSSDGDGSFSWIDEAAATTYTADEDTLTLTGTVFSVETGGIDTAELADNSVETTKIDDLAVTAAKIANGTITSTKLEDDSVTVNKINDDAVTSAKIADGAVLEAALASNSVTSAKINSSAVTADELDVDGDGTNGQFLASDGDGSFTWTTASGGTQYSADGTTLALSDTNVFSVADVGIESAQLASNSVTSAKIMDNNVGADELNVSGDGSSGQFLASDGDGTFSWTTGSTTLQGLTDTNIPASISDRRLLEFEPSDGTWNATSISDILRISDMFDVHEDTPTDGQFLRYDADNADGPGWVNTSVTIPGAVAAGTGISVTGSTVSVANNGITNTQLANNSVRTENITNGTITGSDMAEGAIDTDQIADDAVTANKIANNTITATQIEDGAITATQIADNTITATQILDETITASKIVDNTITAVQLATDSVTSFKIVDGAVTADELDVTGDGSSGQILSSNGDGSFSWINEGDAVAYTAGTGLNLSDSNEFSIADGGVGSTQIADDAVTSEQMANNAIQTAAINAAAVTDTKLANASVTNSKIATGAVMSGSIGSDAVTTIKIIDAAVTSGKLATDIPISTFSDINTTGVNNGQILTYNGTTWVPTNNSGGGNTDNSRLSIALSPNSFNMGDSATSVTITLSIANAISGETISGQSVTITDPLGHTAAVSGSGNDWTFTPSTANAGNYVIRASATFTTGGTSTVHSASVNLPIHAQNSNWYQDITSTVPTAIGTMDNNGVYNSPENATFTSSNAANDDRKAYLALPTRAGGYNFTVGVFPASTLTDLGVISTNYTLYRVSDADFRDSDSAATIITITEA